MEDLQFVAASRDNWRHAKTLPDHGNPNTRRTMSIEKVHWRPQIFAALLLITFAITSANAQTVRRTVAAWKTDAELESQLETLVGIRWSGNPLRAALQNLAQRQTVAIFLDRRVDPDQRVDFSVQDVPLRDMLAGLADSLQQGVAQIGAVVYIGPPITASRLATVAAIVEDQIKALPGSARLRLLDRQRFAGDELTEPRSLAQQLAADYGLRIENLDRIPHDLWPAVDLPPMTFTQHMSLLLAGFDLTFEFSDSGRTIRLIPLPENAVVQRSYTKPRDATPLIAAIRRQFPAATIREQQDQLVLTGPIEAHAAIDKMLKHRTTKKPPAKPAASETRYSLKIENQPVGGIADALGKRLGRTVRYEPATTERMKILVSFDVQDVTLDELLKALLTPAGLAYQLDDQTLLIISSR
jgi:hypothetical protein